jgi:hypothetical protein
MEGGSLFNPGFLGSSFNWWIGQIASDSTWRDNIIPGKFESKDQIPGWGRRYKVRIIGLHDQGETEIPSDQLPWAQVMYPVTAGGGQAYSFQTANLRQGNFVFGFFLDGQEQQVPVIMGVLGNNAQTVLSTRIGDNRVSNTQPGSLATSGYAEPADGNKDPNIRVPDSGLVITKPKSQEQSQECSPSPKGVKVNQFGLRSDKSLSRAQFQDQQNAIREAERQGLTGEERSNFIQRSVAQGVQNRCQEANSPNSPAQPGATRENVDAVHEQSVADVKRHNSYLKKTVMLNPCDIPGSAMKGIQTELDNLTKEIDTILHTATSYVDAVSNRITDIASQIQNLIANFACIIAKYMKIIFDKIFEYILKTINTALEPTVDLMFPNDRNLYLTIKEQIVELIKCLYSKITGNLCAQIQGYLDDILDKRNPSPDNASPYVPICAVENMVGSVLSANMKEIDNTITDILSNVNTFLDDIKNSVSSLIPGGMPSIDIGDINVNITSALSFENISLSIFGCDLKPNCASSDYYTLQEGSGAAEEVNQPRFTELDRISQDTANITSAERLPFAEPLRGTPPVDYRVSDRRSQEEISNGISNLA